MGWIIAAAVLAFLVTGMVVGGIFATNHIYHPRRFTPEQAVQHERDMGAWVESAFEAEDAEPFTVPGAAGAELAATWLWADRAAKKAVVIMHGFGCRAINSYKYARLFMERGYNALIFDNRHAGQSSGKRTTLGYLEREDLKLVVSAAFDRLGEGAVVGLHGESQGGATVIMEACQDSRLAFVVADCPFGELSDQLAHTIRQAAHLPRYPFVPSASLINRVRAGFFFSEVSPAKDLAAAGGLPGLPMLFIHGTEDALIPCAVGKALFELKAGPKALWLCEGAAHARSLAKDPTGYRAALFGFLQEHGL